MAFGVQVDAWGAVLPERAKIANDLKTRLINQVKQRGLDDLTILQGNIRVAGSNERREHLIFKKGQGSGDAAVVAVRIAPHGAKDLEISWRLMEQNLTNEWLAGCGQAALIIIGAFLTIIGLALLVVGVGLCIIPIAIGMIGGGTRWYLHSGQATSASEYQQLDARIFVTMIDHCLMAALDELGVTGDEIHVLLQSQFEGIGQLGKEIARPDIS